MPSGGVRARSARVSSPRRAMDQKWPPDASPGESRDSRMVTPANWFPPRPVSASGLPTLRRRSASSFFKGKYVRVAS